MEYTRENLIAIKEDALEQIAKAARGEGPGGLPDAKGSEQLIHSEFLARWQKIIDWCDAKLLTVDGPTVGVKYGTLG